RGAVGRRVLGCHRRQLDLLERRSLERHADTPARVAHHERHRLRRGLLSRDDQVALVLAVGVVHDDDGLTAGDGFDRVLDRGERHHQFPSREVDASRRSTYLAIRSASRLTAAPLSLCPRVVTARVCGMTATSKLSSPRAATVRLIPSTATDPFATT